ncbi:MAG: transcriptional repressor [Phycisphaera sp.]|nr:transcriptional repressor [Phycisphaera sp.]
MDSQPGQRSTPQRQVIGDVIRRADGPLSVEEIHERALGDMPGLGIATVYRTVKLLLEHGQIKSVVLDDGVARYEAADLGHHHHFRCLNCDRVFDLDVCPVEFSDATKLPHGFVVEDHELTLFGTCPTCTDQV